jgi:hypothetical protein
MESVRADIVDYTAKAAELLWVDLVEPVANRM